MEISDGYIQLTDEEDPYFSLTYGEEERLCLVQLTDNESAQDYMKSCLIDFFAKEEDSFQIYEVSKGDEKGYFLVYDREEISLHIET
jgi:hypothetical protein